MNILPPHLPLSKATGYLRPFQVTESESCQGLMELARESMCAVVARFFSFERMMLEPRRPRVSLMLFCHAMSRVRCPPTPAWSVKLLKE